jgi:hypothetical protein
MGGVPLHPAVALLVCALLYIRRIHVRLAYWLVLFGVFFHPGLLERRARCITRDSHTLKGLREMNALTTHRLPTRVPDLEVTLHLIAVILVLGGQVVALDVARIPRTLLV